VLDQGFSFKALAMRGCHLKFRSAHGTMRSRWRKRIRQICLKASFAD